MTSRKEAEQKQEGHEIGFTYVWEGYKRSISDLIKQEKDDIQKHLQTCNYTQLKLEKEKVWKEQCEEVYVAITDLCMQFVQHTKVNRMDQRDLVYQLKKNFSKSSDLSECKMKRSSFLSGSSGQEQTQGYQRRSKQQTLRKTCTIINTPIRGRPIRSVLNDKTKTAKGNVYICTLHGNVHICDETSSCKSTVVNQDDSCLVCVISGLEKQSKNFDYREPMKKIDSDVTTIVTGGRKSFLQRDFSKKLSGIKRQLREHDTLINDKQRKKKRKKPLTEEQRFIESLSQFDKKQREKYLKTGRLSGQCMDKIRMSVFEKAFRDYNIQEVINEQMYVDFNFKFVLEEKRALENYLIKLGVHQSQKVSPSFASKRTATNIPQPFSQSSKHKKPTRSGSSNITTKQHQQTSFNSSENGFSTDSTIYKDLLTSTDTHSAILSLNRESLFERNANTNLRNMKSLNPMLLRDTVYMILFNSDSERSYPESSYNVSEPRSDNQLFDQHLKQQISNDINVWKIDQERGRGNPQTTPHSTVVRRKRRMESNKRCSDLFHPTQSVFKYRNENDLIDTISSLVNFRIAEYKKIHLNSNQSSEHQEPIHWIELLTIQEWYQATANIIVEKMMRYNLQHHLHVDAKRQLVDFYCGKIQKIFLLIQTKPCYSRRDSIKFQKSIPVILHMLASGFSTLVTIEFTEENDETHLENQTHSTTDRSIIKVAKQIDFDHFDNQQSSDLQRKSLLCEIPQRTDNQSPTESSSDYVNVNKTIQHERIKWICGNYYNVHLIEPHDILQNLLPPKERMSSAKSSDRNTKTSSGSSSYQHTSSSSSKSRYYGDLGGSHSSYKTLPDTSVESPCKLPNAVTQASPAQMQRSQSTNLLHISSNRIAAYCTKQDKHIKCFFSALLNNTLLCDLDEIVI